MDSGFEQEEVVDVRQPEARPSWRTGGPVSVDQQQAAGTRPHKERKQHNALVDGSTPEAQWRCAWQCLEVGDYLAAAEYLDSLNLPAPAQRQLDLAQQDARARVARALTRLAHSAERGHEPITSPISGALPPLTITNMGGFRIRRGVEVLPIYRGRKPISLFRYLLSREQHSAHREELMEALWPQARPREAAHSLHVAVSALRQYLDCPNDSYLLFVAGQYTLNPASLIDDDSRTFAQASVQAESFWRSGDVIQAQQAYTTAIAHYHGDYYVDGQDLIWAVAERERLLTSYLTALERLGDIAMAQQEFKAAAAAYARLLERDNYREDVYCQIMRCYLALGRRGEALSLYKRCLAMLADELGLEPMPETQQLYQSIVAFE